MGGTATARPAGPIGLSKCLKSVSHSKHQGDLFEDVKEVPTGWRNGTKDSLRTCDFCRETYLSVDRVAARYDTSKATIWRWAKNNPAFPKSVQLSRGTTRWRLSDLVAFECLRGTNGATSVETSSLGGKR